MDFCSSFMVKTFKQLKVGSDLIHVLDRLKIVEPTEIQEKALPYAMKGKDLVGVSKTGSGKTLIYAAKIIDALEEEGFPQAVVLTPTRELAEQVAGVVEILSDLCE